MFEKGSGRKILEVCWGFPVPCEECLSSTQPSSMGYSCLHSLKILNCSVGCPLTTDTPTNFFLVSEFSSKMFIHFLKFCPNLKISKVFWIKVKETESEAFSKSTRIASPGLLVLIACSITLCVFLVASLMNLSESKLFDVGPIFCLRLF